jgi:hypothetical protein
MIGNGDELWPENGNWTVTVQNHDFYFFKN